MPDDRQALAEAITPALPELADDIIGAIRDEVDIYRRPLTGAFGANVRLGVELALGRFMAEFAGAPPRERNRAVYVELGRGEFREGRSLDALLSAYRVGARLSWRRIVDVGREAGIAPDVLYELGEAMFAYIDGLSAESTEGYAQAQEAAAGGRALERRRLLALLLSDPPPDETVLRAAADSARWPLPRTLAVLATDADDPDALAARLGHGVLAADADPAVAAGLAPAAAPLDRSAADATSAALRTDDGGRTSVQAARTGAPASRTGAQATRTGDQAARTGDPATRTGDGPPARAGDGAPTGGGPADPPRPAGPRAVVALLPDPDAPGRRGSVAAALGREDAALGPSVAPGRAALSAARARLAHRLQAEGRLPGGLVAAADHLPALLLHADPVLAGELADAALAPLDRLAPGARDKLAATLRAWLDAQGRIDPTAAALNVHPQTVRYRLGQLREALGDALDDPDARLALDLALRADARWPASVG